MQTTNNKYKYYFIYLLMINNYLKLNGTFLLNNRIVHKIYVYSMIFSS